MGDNIWKNKKSDEIPSTLEIDSSFLKLLLKNGRILDLGCGNGNSTIKMAKQGFEVHGVDLSYDAIEVGKLNAKNIENCFFTQMSVSDLKFKEEYFDAITIKAVLTVVLDYDTRKKIMQEAFRMLKKGGYMFLAEFAQTWQNEYYRNRYITNYEITKELGLFKVYDDNGKEAYMAKHFSNKEITDLYIEAGFKTYSFITDKVRTRSGNIIDGYKVVLMKA